MAPLIGLAGAGMLGKLLKDISTGIDGHSYDVGRVMFLIWGIVYAAIGIYFARISNAEHPFPFTEFGTGAGFMAGGMAVLLKLKADTEPNRKIVTLTEPDKQTTTIQDETK